MITIEHRGTGFKIKCSNPGMNSRSYSVHADDLDQVIMAVRHYYGHHVLDSNCPLCKLVEKLEKPRG